MGSWVWVLAGASLLLAGCADLAGYVRESTRGPERTFDKLLRRAYAGDPGSQYAVGFMLFFGETVPANRPEAHRWFHLAASQRHPQAQLDLAVIHFRGMGLERDLAESERFLRLARENPSAQGDPRLGAVGSGSVADLAALLFSARADGKVTRGERTYTTFCAGCHGLNGLAAYGGAPSFALGERLGVGDARLLHAILEGKRVMPVWGNKLPTDDLRAALAFIRGLEWQYRLGVSQVLREAPPLYFLFGPMQFDDRGYRRETGEDSPTRSPRPSPR